MKKIIIILMLFTLISCSNKGELKVINNTSHNLYFIVKNENYLLESEQKQTLSIKTGYDFSIFSEKYKNIPLVIWGDTYQLGVMGDFEKFYGPDTTTIKIITGETTSVYCSPNRALLKVINHTNKIITKIRVTRKEMEPPNYTSIITADYETNVLPGEEEKFTILPKNAHLELEVERVHSFTVFFLDGSTIDHENNNSISINSDNVFIWDVKM